MTDCTRKFEFTIPGSINTKVAVEEGDFNGDGFTDMKFTVAVDESGGKTADLRLLAWDMADEGKLPAMSVFAPESPHITDQRFQANSVVDLGNGANLSGDITNKGKGFDAGVEIGTQGIGKDDIQTTSFVVAANGQNLTLDDIGGERFGVRLTSVGEIGGPRADSLKLAAIAPHAPDAIDDLLTTNEDTAASLILLANDTDGDGDPLTVTEIEGGTLGVSFAVVSDGGRTASVTAQADGTFHVDPAGNFEDLSTGETDTFDLQYKISDGNGGEDCATVTVTIEGVNDAPVANDDLPFFVEFGDVALVNVAANDTDIDGTVDPTTLVFAGADYGTAVQEGGQLKYTANAIAYDTTDSSVNDALTYTVQDNEGAVSNAANVTAKVIDPLRETDIDSADAVKNGQPISLSLSTEDRTFNTSSFVEVGIQAGPLVQPDINVSFVVDESGSISSAQFIEEREAVQDTINLLRSDFAGTGTTVTVQIVEFASGAGQATYDLFDPVLNNIAVGTPLASQSGGATNYEAALDRAVTFFTGKAAEDNFLLFTSDGEPNTPNSNPATFTDEVAELEALNVSRTAVGFGGATVSTLNLIDNTGGAQVFADADQLGDAFGASPLFPADLLTFSLTVNGNEVANQSNLTSLGGGDYSYDGTLTGLLNGLGNNNTVVATATFDVDNDNIADETRTAQTIINGTDGTDVLFA